MPLRLRFNAARGLDRALAARMRAERNLQGLSVGRLARAAGMAPTQLQLIEMGWSRMSASEMMHLLMALGRTPSWLFEDLL